MTIRLERLWVCWEPDLITNPVDELQDASRYRGCPQEEIDKYMAEDKQRLDAYFRGAWWVRGCVAYAQVSYPINPHGDRRLEVLSSGGLWGIDSDSESGYLDEVEREELYDLKKHLEVFGIDTSHFEEIRPIIEGR